MRWTNTLRVWRGTTASLALFLRKKDRREAETVTVYETRDRTLHVWTYGEIGPETVAALQLTKVDTIKVGATAEFAA